MIRDSNSKYSSPVVMIKKKDGSERFCVDYRNLNALTIKDKFRLPRIYETLDHLGSSKYFSIMDLKTGYWQIPVKECDKEKTSFVTHNGLYEWNVMPFGLCNALATF
ncbi:MAG: reverse transcriptase family protein [Flavobacterium sp.]